MAPNAFTGSDSAFSLIASTTGILTFLLGVLASYIAFQALARDSIKELEDFTVAIQQTTAGMLTLDNLRNDCPPLAATRESEALHDLAGKMANATNALLEEITGHPPGASIARNEEAETPWYDFQLRRRTWWILTKGGLVGRMGKMGELKRDVLLAQNNFLIA